ncbi:MAG: BlaI/MecI/CopY family transcriptional regulator [Pseudomonadota bacterium]
MPRPKAPQLTIAERRIMDVLWSKGEASVRDVADALKDEHDLAYTTVLTTMKIMAEKGHLGFRKEGRAHIYRPLLSRDGARRNALGTLVSSLFDGSPQRLAQHLVEDDKLTLEDIEALRAELIKRQSGGSDT